MEYRYGPTYKQETCRKASIVYHVNFYTHILFLCVLVHSFRTSQQIKFLQVELAYPRPSPNLEYQVRITIFNLCGHERPFQ